MGTVVVGAIIGVCVICGGGAALVWVRDRVTSRGTWEVYKCQECGREKEFKVN